MDDWLDYSLDAFDVLDASSEVVSRLDVSFDLVEGKGRYERQDSNADDDKGTEEVVGHSMFSRSSSLSFASAAAVIS